MKKNYHVFFTMLLCFFLAQAVSSQNMTGEMSGGSPSLVKLTAGDLQGTSGKIISLADAMPAEDYNWRPMEGVRSVSEVYVHIALTNYFILSYCGVKMPDNLKPGSENTDLEKTITGKKEVMELLKKSFDATQKFLDNYDGADLNTKVELPFGKFTKGQLLMILTGHAHEHLGQSIAYARMNKIVPPWSGKQ